MALQKKLFSIGFRGLQTKFDAQTADVGTFQTVDNYYINKSHLLQKAPGFSQIATKNTLTNISTMYSLGSESGIITDKSLYAYSPVIDTYISKGSLSVPTITSKPILANTAIQSNPDSSTTSNSILGVVWEDNRTTGTIRCSIKDLINDTILSGDYIIATSATAVKPKCIAVGTSLFFLYVDTSTTSLNIVKYNTITQSFSTVQTVSTNVSSTNTYDVISAQSNLIIVINENTAAPNALKAYYWMAGLNVSGSTAYGVFNPTSLNATNADNGCVALQLTYTAGYVSCAYWNSTQSLFTFTFDLTFTKFSGSELLVATTANPGYTCAIANNTSNQTFIYYTSKSVVNVYNTYFAQINNNIGTATLSSASQQYTQLTVATRAFYYNGNIYVGLAYDSIYQPSYFLVRDDQVCSARLFGSLAGGSVTKANSVSSWTIRPDKTNTYMCALLKKTKITASSGAYLSTTSVFSEQVYFTPYGIDTKQIRNTLLMAGGFLKQYDGQSTVVEQGFHLYPETPTYSTATGSIPAGSYSYILCWEWTDNYGQIIRSNTSAPLQITTASSSNITLTVPTLPITAKQASRTPPVLAVYRTVTNGTTYYRVNQLSTTWVYNDTTQQTISFVDSSLDSAIISNAVLYTTGGVFTNISLPTTNLMTIAKNRVIVAGTDNETNKVYYSKEKEEGIGIEFSNELSFIVDNLGGDITALAAMDDKILIFKKSLVYYVAGTGADKLGNGSFSVPQLVSADCGCSQPQSIVLTGIGIMFKSQKGIYLINRQLEVSYIGENVDAYNQYTLTSATNLPDQNLVTFTTLEGYILKYDTYFNFWYTCSGVPITSSTINGTTWYISNSTQSFQATPGAYSVAGEPITSTLKTSWINVADIGGFQRIYAIVLTGVDKGQVDRLTVNLKYDFQDYVSQTLTIQPNLTNTTYGSDATYGSVSPYGGSNRLNNQFVIRPRQQKCTAIQIEIIDSMPQGTPLAGFSISDISLELGILGGYNKGLSPATQRLV